MVERCPALGHGAAVRVLQTLVLRIVLVFLITSLCSFVALNAGMLRTLYFIVADFVDFVLELKPFTEPTVGLVWLAYWHSLILLASAMVLGFVFGIPLGFASATARFAPVRRIADLISAVGIMTPSFLLGVFIMVFFV